MSDRPSPESPPLRQAAFGHCRKEGRYVAAVFEEGGVAEGAAVTDDDGQDDPAAVGKNGFGADEILALVHKAKIQELDAALKKLQSGAVLTTKEMGLVTKHARDLHVWEAEKSGLVNVIPGEGGYNRKVVQRAVEELDAWRVNGDEKFQVRREEQWLEVGPREMFLMLKRWGLSDIPPGMMLSQVEEALLYITENRVLDIAIADLAGYPAGVREMRGCQILVRQGPRLIEPKEGEWLFIEQFIADRLMLPEEEGGSFEQRRVQFDRFNCWLARAVENLYEDCAERLDTHVMILAGPPQSSKSRLQHSLITPVFGGLYGDPSNYFFGESTFNEGWIGKGHLLIEDPNPSSKMYDRLKFGQNLKRHTVNAGVTLHPKGKSEIGVETRHRISISVNSHPDSLKVLPPLSADFRDKVLLFRVVRRPLALPTRTAAERREFRRRIGMELPAYIWWLLHECRVPEHLREDRCGFQAYWDPELKAILWEDTPTSEFLELVDSATTYDVSAGSRPVFAGAGSYTGEEAIEEYGFRGASRAQARTLAMRAVQERKRLWIGGAADIHKLLLKSEYDAPVKKLVANNQVGAMLGRLAAEMPERVAQFKTDTNRLWVIIAPTSVEEEHEPAGTAA